MIYQIVKRKKLRYFWKLFEVPVSFFVDPYHKKCGHFHGRKTNLTFLENIQFFNKKGNIPNGEPTIPNGDCYSSKLF